MSGCTQVCAKCYQRAGTKENREAKVELVPRCSETDVGLQKFDFGEIRCLIALPHVLAYTRAAMGGTYSSNARAVHGRSTECHAGSGREAAPWRCWLRSHQ